MNRFVRTKNHPFCPQAAGIFWKGRHYSPVFWHATIHQDRAVGSRTTFTEHIHNFYHIVLYTKGRGWYCKEGRFWPAEPGTCVLIHPGQRHEFITRRQTAVYSELTFSYEHPEAGSLALSFEQLVRIYTGLELNLQEPASLTAEQTQSLLTLLIQMTDYLNSSRLLSVYYAHRTLEQIFDFLAEHASRRQNEQCINDRAARVRQWIEQHYLEPISMEQAARIAGVSKSYFFRTFKKAFNTTPLAYQQKLRLEAAKTLLRATSLTCSQAADRAGFKDIFFFHRLFKKYTGQTPRQYRRSFDR
ncbi:MAG TPA: AraC family transcriptional regulator [Anaerohalosphaeraceae bacterium]|nr:AraC family transcriptional regulator [Anaerohalosphaeraceae bacterium]HOL31136.1 AraC family transcriptional regulator [Anaerohalosphaeraceae bacterium]HOM76491.1 AraC family transcriptional regulator [Anaerohalosphaeraceae bacterium]HPC64621.1 AraC family transcriptional regulator [Anaerohalosphaeraceae bacterium]HPO69859.1 AraC family transcriptional regulator [Anaerohalosphaeraceae bacterium]